MTNTDKFDYIINHWYLKNDVVYSREADRSVSFIKNKRGYHTISVKVATEHYMMISEHEAVFVLHHKRPIGDGMVIHHKDHNKLNNTPDNLVELTQKQHRRIHAYQNGDPLRGITQRKGSWVFQWPDDEGKLHTKYFRKLIEAMKFRDEIEEPRRQELRDLGLDC